MHCKHSVAGSRRAAWRYVTCPQSMPPSLVDFALGGRYYEVDPPPRPMSGPQFEKWRRDWEQERQWEAAADRARREHPFVLEAAMAATADEDASFLAAVELSKKDAEEKARAEAEEEAQALADVEAFKAREAAGVVVLDD